MQFTFLEPGTKFKTILSIDIYLYIIVRDLLILFE